MKFPTEKITARELLPDRIAHPTVSDWTNPEVLGICMTCQYAAFRTRYTRDCERSGLVVLKGYRDTCPHWEKRSTA